MPRMHGPPLSPKRRSGTFGPDHRDPGELSHDAQMSDEGWARRWSGHLVQVMTSLDAGTELILAATWVVAGEMQILF